MKFITGLIALIYTIVFIVIGTFLMGISLEVFSNAQLKIFLDILYNSPLNLLYIGILGLIVIFISMVYIYCTLKGRKKKRTISFKNPDGKVSISLGAIEDFVARISQGVTEIKNIDCKVVSNKGGVKVVNRVTLRAGISVSEITKRFQEMIKLKLQEMLGVENDIEVVVNVQRVEKSQEDQETRNYGGEIDYSK